ncbi:RagB/SusD family nutrient uptake outer membrane protein [Flavobacterium cellulosilyticum]|uniref:RagB/SusD family nutrient uptake outer membrane protein n=1 Tax=Flavobacterium cellulosilyticum TaxID=2541731 RepID=A0A4R5CM18_9FLAO|nr:RagB/SusD family nutrient uptake outer membrane protein [Flavobacterium cellulosilyticum]TDD99453.1 RagB/SusD family nutrient uptake outer membrane protein [Flavobacterium cellulosilyticum]
MKYKIYNYLAGFFSLAIISTSCVNDADLIQLDPNNDAVDSFWKTDQDAIKGVNAAYGSLLTDGTYMRSTPLLLDLKGDDTRSNSPWDAMYNVGRFNSNASNAAIYGWAYETYYQGIYRANQVLENVSKIDMADAGLKNRIIGQAYFLRGLYLFHAVNLFKNVPLPTEIAAFYPQKTNEEGWKQVIADFKAAADLLPNSYTSVTGLDAGQKGRATKGAALGYLGKAYLFTKDFANAKTTFKQVIDLGVYSLVTNYRDNFTDTNENNSESLFEVQFSRSAGGVDLGWGGAPATGWGKTSARAITYAPRAFGWTDVQPTRTLFNEYQQEKTTANTVDPRLDATIFYNKPGGMQLYGKDFATFYAANPGDLNDLFCRKYQNSDGNYANEYDWRSGINERLLRYADVLLMYAESLNETGDTPGAYTYIKMVRDRAGLPNLAITKPGLTQATMREQIGHERFLEFPLEGHRFDDIRRWGWLQDPVKLAWLKSRDVEFNSYATGREYFPIPQLDIDNNPGTVQNPSY